MMKIGPEKPIAVVFASGMLGKAVNQKHNASVCNAPRVNWPVMFCGLYTAMPFLMINGNSSSKPAVYRKNCVSNGGKFLASKRSKAFNMLNVKPAHAASKMACILGDKWRVRFWSL